MNQLFNQGARVFHYKYGEGVVAKVNLTNYDVIFIKSGKLQISHSNEDLEIIEDGPETENNKPKIDISQFEEIINYTLEKYGIQQENIPLGEKYINGKLIITPNNPDLQNKEIPIETFFHKIVMVRDRLRVLEQNINSHKKLNDEEKVDLQQYITRCYGSLTTFNFLFKEKEHYFVGEKKND